jgi:hypothetical protein
METKTIYISEKQYKEVYETILQESLVVNNNLVKDVVKYLDKHCKAIKYDDVDENGDATEPDAIQMLSRIDGEPLQTMNKSKLVGKLCDRYENKIKNNEDRHKFFERLVDQWIDGTISKDGFLNVNIIK